MLGYIEFENDPKIGSVKLDFMKDESSAYSTVVLIGENGSGKTSVLRSIEKFLKDTYLWETSSVKKVIYFDSNNRKYTILREKDSKKRGIPTGFSEEDVKQNLYDQNHFLAEKEELATDEPHDIRNRKYVYSEARSGFEITLKENDESFVEDEELYEKRGADYTGIVQLLLDIETKDENAFLMHAKKNPHLTYAEYLDEYSYISRFKNAFESMFDGVTYVGKEAKSNTILFSNGYKCFDISELSTGEKQIVLRGTDILFHAEKGGIVFIDEPELSLHPRWQEKILNFYRDLFKDKDGKQMVQLIIATHSQYIVRSALEQKENVKVLVLKKENTNLIADVPKMLLLDNFDSSEVNYLTFGVEGEAYHIRLFGKLHNQLINIEGNNVNQFIRSMDTYIRGHRCFNEQIHRRDDDSFGQYYTLPLFIRNAIDHPNEERQYTEQDLAYSIELLRQIMVEENLC